MSTQASEARPANRLAKEKSPYLLQHAHNPVDWFPWGEEAFQKARLENKPIFLSIGYSTCHWCHVMERESFEDGEIAALLKSSFVAIKVDREERPDVDHVYMNAIQMMTGSGGWPLTVFMTPEGKPFSGGTYFPPEDRWGRPGMKTVLPRVAEIWKTKREDIEKTGTEVTGLLGMKTSKKSDRPVDSGVFDQAFKQFEAHFDPYDGGFGQAPKFPRSHELSFLLRYWKKNGNASALEMIKKTLYAMAYGGMYDHLGGGFHRYSTDSGWLVPHFEKMLYDQAILAQTYLEAYQAVGDTFYAEVARDIFQYVLRDMTDSAGGFYSAEDADSEGEEGKFYVWFPQETEAVLGAEDGRLFNAFYGITEKGNFEHAASIAHLSESVEDYARKAGLIPEDLKKRLALMRQKLFAVRKKRISPYKDDKVLTSWNGLMISALAKGGRILGDPSLIEAASRCADFLLTRMRQKGVLLRRYRAGDTAITGFQEDYAFLALGLLDLYEATFELRWFAEAKHLSDQMLELFWDSEAGGFFYTAAESEKLIARSKEYYDGAIPSGNSIAAMLLIRLSRMTGDADYEHRANQTIQSNAAGLLQYPSGFPELLMAYDFAIGPTKEIVLSGDPLSPEFRRLKRTIDSRFNPWQVVLAYSLKNRAEIEVLAPHLKDMKEEKDKTLVYICRNFACQLPVTTECELEEALNS